MLATIPATVQADVPTIALLAHVDTAPQFSGANVKPNVHRNYSGEDIVLPDDPSQVLSPQALPYLAQKVGDDIVTASGTTLLGADDKAGVAIIMAAARHLLQNPDLPHGPIRIGFTSDEEIGRGVHANLPGDLKADFAYTLDGAHLGEIVYETFSADGANVHRQGRADPPRLGQGQAGQRRASGRQDRGHLPQATLTPETTSGRQGFLHIVGMKGSAAEMTIDIILRDFERERLAAQGDLLTRYARPSRPASRAPRSPARSLPSIATCATGWRTTCARSSWRVRRAGRSASNRSRCPCAAAPTARG